MSSKYDGSLRDSYEAQLLDFEGTMIRLKVPAGTLVHDGRTNNTVESEDTAIEVYFLDRWYNVWHFREHTTYTNLWYANVATPADFDGHTLKWTDLDLDVRCHPDRSLEVLDEDEFEQNRLSMRYPDDLVDRAIDAKNEILNLGGQEVFPFDHEEQLRHAERGY